MAANSPATVFFEVAEDPGEPDPVVSMESVGSGLNMGTVLFFLGPCPPLWLQDARSQLKLSWPCVQTGARAPLPNRA